MKLIRRDATYDGRATKCQDWTEVYRHEGGGRTVRAYDQCPGQSAPDLAAEWTRLEGGRLDVGLVEAPEAPVAHLQFAGRKVGGQSEGDRVYEAHRALLDDRWSSGRSSRD